MNTSKHIATFVLSGLYTTSWWFMYVGSFPYWVPRVVVVLVAVITILALLGAGYFIRIHWNDTEEHQKENKLGINIAQLILNFVGTSTLVSGILMLIYLRQYGDGIIAAGTLMTGYSSVALLITIARWIYKNWNITY